MIEAKLTRDELISLLAAARMMYSKAPPGNNKQKEILFSAIVKLENMLDIPEAMRAVK